MNGDLTDSTATHDTGTVVGASLTTDELNRPNRGYLLNGGDYLINNDYSSLFDASAGVSVEVMVNPTSIAAFGLIFFNNYLGGAGGDLNNNFCMYQYGTTGLLRFFIWDSAGTGHDLYSVTGMSAGVWSHVVATYDGVTMVIYINGKLDNSAAAAYGVLKTITNDTFRLGRNKNAVPTQDYKGKFSLCRLWNRGLSAEEAKQLYNKIGCQI